MILADLQVFTQGMSVEAVGVFFFLIKVSLWFLVNVTTIKETMRSNPSFTKNLRKFTHVLAC